MITDVLLENEMVATSSQTKPFACGTKCPERIGTKALVNDTTKKSFDSSTPTGGFVAAVG